MGDALDELFEKYDVVCQSAATFLAVIRSGAENEVLRRVGARVEPRLMLGSALVKYEYKGSSLTYVAPNRLIIRLGRPGVLEDAKALLRELVAP